MSEARSAQYPVAAQFVERWSPRSLTGEAIDDQTLFSLFEAARWAPSAYNVQPWRFSYAKHGSGSWDAYLEFLNDFNRSWAKNASALVVVLSKTTSLSAEQEVENPSHSFDTGAAWASLALQAHLSGWVTHGMTGIHKEKIREVLELPENYTVEAVIAIGKRGDKSALPEGLQAKESPNERRPLEETVFEGLGFKA
ncbi:nitroreductase family protein [Halotalea alkalilenta]|uniref:nitroreductase family protein n=1 Tax=Halotalea alkalilenta TaxID=376489 RepID=UPI00047FBE99|nr:nitroreductase family protein [Halotalea alkalilenta]